MVNTMIKYLAVFVVVLVLSTILFGGLLKSATGEREYIYQHTEDQMCAVMYDDIATDTDAQNYDAVCGEPKAIVVEETTYSF